MKRFCWLSSMLMVMSCTNNDTTADNNPAGTAAPTSATVMAHSVLAVYPHDTSSYTQGLTFYKGELYENSGQYGQSRLRRVALETGAPVQEIKLEDRYFGEGITVLNDTLYQLTWKEQVVFVYDPATLQRIRQFPINTEGWGITNDGQHLIVSDGSSNLYFYDPATFRLLRTQGVTEGGSPAINLNELEFINGYVYANQYGYNYILKIDPNSGQVVSKLNLSELETRAKSLYPGAEVLNGIAYNPDSKKIYVTGKYWPQLYEISFPL